MNVIIAILGIIVTTMVGFAAILVLCLCAVCIMSGVAACVDAYNEYNPSNRRKADIAVIACFVIIFAIGSFRFGKIIQEYQRSNDVKPQQQIGKVEQQ